MQANQAAGHARRDNSRRLTLGGQTCFHDIQRLHSASFFYVSPNQANIQIPWEVKGLGSAALRVTTTNGSNEFPVRLSEFAPAIFSVHQQGSGQGAIAISGSDILAAPAGSIPGAKTRAAAKGEFISIYCLGLGTVDHPPANGEATPDSSSITRAPVTVLLNGVSLTPAFAGLAPGFVGLFQVNVQIARSGRQPPDARGAIDTWSPRKW